MALLLLMVSLFGAAPAPAVAPAALGDPIVAEANGRAILRSEVVAYLAAGVAPTEATLAAATVRAVDDALLAAEAGVLLSAKATERPNGNRSLADAVRREAFGPGHLCRRIPIPILREKYDDERWRFIAPPSWRVDDIQVLCCHSARECGTDASVACIERTTPAADALRDDLPESMSHTAFRDRYSVWYDAGRPVAWRSFRFFFDPADPAAKMDWRLQEADPEYAQASARLAPRGVGAIAPRTTTRFGHHLIRLADMRPALALTFDDPRTRALLTAELCPGHRQTVIARFLSDLKAHARIDVDATAIRSLLSAGP